MDSPKLPHPIAKWSKSAKRDQGNVHYWPKRACSFFKKKGTKSFTTPYSMLIRFLHVLPKNKGLHNFHNRGQHRTAGHIKGLDLGLVAKVFCQYAL